MLWSLDHATMQRKHAQASKAKSAIGRHDLRYCVGSDSLTLVAETHRLLRSPRISPTRDQRSYTRIVLQFQHCSISKIDDSLLANFVSHQTGPLVMGVTNIPQFHADLPNFAGLSSMFMLRPRITSIDVCSRF